MTTNRLAAVPDRLADRPTARLPGEVYTRTRQQVQQALGMLMWWCLCIAVPIVGLVAGFIYGTITGAASGAAAGVTEARADLERWWRLLTDGEGR